MNNNQQLEPAGEQPVASSIPTTSEQTAMNNNQDKTRRYEANNATKTKLSKPLIITCVILSILAIGATAFGVYSLMDGNNKKSEIENLQAKLKLIESETGATIENNNSSTEVKLSKFVEGDAEIRKIIDDVYSIASETMKPFNYYEKIYDFYNNMVYVEEAHTATDLEKSYGLYATLNDLEAAKGDRKYSTDVSAPVEEAFKNYLLKSGFTESPELNSFPSWISGANYVNSEKGIVCEIGEGAPSSIRCGMESWVSDEKLSELKQLSDAYYNAKGKYPEYLGLKNAVAKNSIVSPYQTMTVSILDAAGLFYRTSEDAEWQYFTGTQDYIPCEEYNTEDLRNAFAGETCWDKTTNSESTVQP